MICRMDLIRGTPKDGLSFLSLDGYVDLFDRHWLAIETGGTLGRRHVRRVPMKSAVRLKWAVQLLAARYEARGYRISCDAGAGDKVVNFIAGPARPFFDVKLRAFFSDYGLREAFEALYAADIVYVGDLVVLSGLDLCRAVVQSNAMNRSVSRTAELIETRIIVPLAAKGLYLGSARGNWVRPLPPRAQWVCVR